MTLEQTKPHLHVRVLAEERCEHCGCWLPLTWPVCYSSREEIEKANRERTHELKGDAQ